MAAKTDYLEKKILDHVLRGTTYTAPSGIYVGLYTSATADDGTGTECSGTGYARLGPYSTSSPGFSAATLGTGQTSNQGDWTWSVAGGSWGTITHAAILDAASGGNMLYHGPLNASKTISSGDQFKIPAGYFIISED